MLEHSFVSLVAVVSLVDVLSHVNSDRGTHIVYRVLTSFLALYLFTASGVDLLNNTDEREICRVEKVDSLPAPLETSVTMVPVY